MPKVTKMNIEPMAMPTIIIPEMHYFSRFNSFELSFCSGQVELLSTEVDSVVREDNSVS